MAYPEQCIGETPCPFIGRQKGGGDGGKCPDCGETGQLAADTVKPERGGRSTARAEERTAVRPFAEDPHAASPGSRG